MTSPEDKDTDDLPDDAVAVYDRARDQELRMIGTKIGDLRRSRGWNQAELGRRAGVSRNVVNTTENFRNFPSKDSLVRMCKALRTPIEHITDWYSAHQERYENIMTAVSIKEMPESPGYAWVHVNRPTTTHTASKIYNLLNADKTRVVKRS